MIKLARVAGVLALGIAWNSIASAQETPQYSRLVCVKVRDGKDAEYAAFIRETSMKLSKVRVNSGMYASVIYAQAAVPAGRSARCDYHFVFGSNGFPPEAASPAQTEADMKKAGITMSPAAMLAKRNELSYLVSTEIWRTRAMAGNGVAKGGYARLNYYKVKPNMGPAWLNLETTGWKKLAESAAKDMGTSWTVLTLAMPGGANLPYNALTVDGFPSWEALGKGIPSRTIWSKVHPEMDFTQYTDRVSDAAERPRIDIIRVMDVITK